MKSVFYMPGFFYSTLSFFNTLSMLSVTCMTHACNMRDTLWVCLFALHGIFWWTLFHFNVVWFINLFLCGLCFLCLVELFLYPEAMKICSISFEKRHHFSFYTEPCNLPRLTPVYDGRQESSLIFSLHVPILLTEKNTLPPLLYCATFVTPLMSILYLLWT